MTDDGAPAVRVFASPVGNAFMVDIATWIAEAARLLGRTVELVTDGRVPDDPTAINLVVAPHELFGLSTSARGDIRRAAEISVPVATEQPGTVWFDRSVEFCRHAPAVLDINASAVDALRHLGIAARHLRLGATPSMDRRRAHRSLDVLVLAGLTDARAERLAELAPVLASHRADIRLFPPSRPAIGTTPGTLFGGQKYELLATARLVLNLHRDRGSDYFEWARAVEAMANGAVFVTEPSTGFEPLEPDVHLVIDDDLGRAIEDLLSDPGRIDAISRAAADLVHGELALDRSLEPILSELDEVPAALRATPTPMLRGARGRPGHTDAPGRARLPAFRPYLDLRRRTMDAVIAERALRREIDAERCRLRHGTPDHVTIDDTPAWEEGRPEVSAIVTLFDYADLVTETLDSLAASEGVDLEIVVVDDHSRDDGRTVVRRWLDAHPEVPARLVGSDANRGLAASRNLAISHGRADRVMVMDADNLVAPRCLRRLADALDDRPDAAFAYSILAVFGARRGLHSAFGWDVSRLCVANDIDAQVMLRRSAIDEVGGYREVPGLLVGWEDWDLWLRFAERGMAGVHVREMLGRYRAQDGSMVSAANRFNEVMLERFEAAHPDLDFPRR